MKHSAIKPTLTRCLTAAILLVLGTVSASAQYYMNIVLKHGDNAKYPVSEIENIYFSGQEEYYEEVDLGLSVNWGTFNVGASRPEEYGSLYAWGETEPKGYYDWGTYKWCDGTSNIMTKYNIWSSFGTIDNDTILDPEDDVAHVKWGGDWRMPTREELNELCVNCSWMWTYELNNGDTVYGYRVSRNGNSIFLPAAGYGSGTIKEDVDSVGYYRSSSLYTRFKSENTALIPFNTAHTLVFMKSKKPVPDDTGGRNVGFSVRPVRPSVKWLSGLSIAIDEDYPSIGLGSTYTLKAIVKHNDEVVDCIVTWSSDDPSIATVSDNGTVTGLSVGSTKITATCYGKTDTCTVIITTSTPTYEYVDLGLSVNWATCNVGALTPGEYGDLYAWGETATKTNYALSSYKFANGTGSYARFTKYNTDKAKGTVDDKTTLDPEDDVAHVEWGGEWRMPTQKEWNELKDNCTWEWVTINGINGFRVTSNISGYTGKSIFLQAGGYYSNKSHFDVGSFGYYWSSTLNTDNTSYAYYLIFDDSGNYNIGANSRAYGRSVRPVCPSKQWLKDVKVIFEISSQTIPLGGTYTIKTTLKHGDDVIEGKVGWSSVDPSIATVDETGMVTGISIGSTKIIVSCYDKNYVFDINVREPDYNGHEYVDLGLSVKWGTCNVGASKPEEYGNHYAWGETETKSDYSWDTYKWSKNHYLTKYCKRSESGYEGFTDNRSTLEPEDDAAHVVWGGDWRMPTSEEIEELITECTWTWTKIDDIKGYRITSNKPGYTDRSIFLPAAGYYEDTELKNQNENGRYLSSSMTNVTDPRIITFWSTDFGSAFGNRLSGQSVRPVCPSASWIKIILDSKYQTITPGATYTIKATIKNGDDVIDGKVVWLSADPSIATVDETGKVTGISVGSTTITASCYGNSAEFEITVKEPTYNNGYEYVDLGLSVKWATCNVGASSPEEYGNYYAWGETETKSEYTWDTYKWCKDSYSFLTKYCNDSEYGNDDFTDTKTTLDPEDDVAHVKWGGDWRMPTKEEQDELLNNCTWKWYDSGNSEFGGVAGYKVTGKKSGYTDRFIFLPAAGCRGDTYLYYVGSYGYYWSSSLYTDCPYLAWYIYFNSSFVGADYYSRYYGLSVRPVCE